MHPRDVSALAWFSGLEARAGGYSFRGVLGWAGSSECAEACGPRVTERLPRLAAAGLLERHDVRSPHLSKPAWIYRLTPAGARAAAVASGAEAIVPEPPRGDENAALYLAPRPRRALAALRRAHDEGTPHELLPGERGWRTSRQLLGRDDPYTGYEPRPRSGWSAGEEQRWDPPTDSFRAGTEDDADEPWGEGWDGLYGEMPADRPPSEGWWTEDLAWLVKAGLAQRWDASAPGRRRAVTLYRVTTWGATAAVLQWHEPEVPPSSP